MYIVTKDKILTSLDEAIYHLEGVVNQSQDELHALDELKEVRAHISDIQGIELPTTPE